jgi:acetyl esterase/lipase
MLDVHAPSEPGPWPVVVVVHGLFKNRSSLEPLSEAIASQGAVVYNIDVGYGVPDNTSALERTACAVRFARDTATDCGSDPSWVSLVGHSSGAHHGAAIALAGDDFAADCAVTDASAFVDALVGYEGVYDWATKVYDDSFAYLGLKDEDPELWQAVNRYAQIGRNPELQVRLLHGNVPDVEWYDVPLAVTREFHKALAEAEYDVELIVVQRGTHDDITSDSDVIAFTVEQVMELARGSSQ